MKRKPITILLFILIMLFLAACQSQVPEAAPDLEQAAPVETTVPPTETPIVEPTDERQEPPVQPTDAASESEADTAETAD